MDKIEVVFGPYYINRILKGNYDYRLKGLKSKLAELNAIYTQFDDEAWIELLKICVYTFVLARFEIHFERIDLWSLKTAMKCMSVRWRI